MDNQFDWNIKNYNTQELQEILELPSNYDVSQIESQAKKLSSNILNDVSTPQNMKQKTLKFIKEVKDALIKTASKNTLNSVATEAQSSTAAIDNLFSVETSIPQNQLIDAGSTYVIKQPVLQYAHAYQSPYNPGILNPLNIRILQQNINIDTRFRNNYYGTSASNFQLDLPFKINGVVSLQLTSLELPYTFYAVSNVFGNNFFSVEIQGYNPLMVIIPDGNYDYIALQGYINNFFTNYAPTPYKNIQVLTDLNAPTAGDLSGSGRMIFGSVDGTQKFSLNFLTDVFGNPDQQTPLPLKLGWMMGYREGYYENSFTYVSEGIVNISGPSYIYLAIDDYNNNVNDGYYGAFNSSVLSKNILARISLQGSVFNTTTSSSLNTNPRTYFGPVTIQKMNIQLLDPYGRILNLNNMDYSFCLQTQGVFNL